MDIYHVLLLLVLLYVVFYNKSVFVHNNTGKVQTYTRHSLSPKRSISSLQSSSSSSDEPSNTHSAIKPPRIRSPTRPIISKKEL
jgi:hypothetical protein